MQIRNDKQEHVMLSLVQYEECRFQYKFETKKSMQSGRSMLEMLLTLSIIGLLVCVAVWGLSVAFRKHKANQILEDVGIGIQSVADMADKEGEVALEFEPVSGYQMSGLMMEKSEERADFVKVLAVEEKVCDVLNKMQGDKLFIYTLHESGESLKRLTECAEETTLYFAYKNYGNEVTGCYPMCGNNAHCVDLYECECDEGTTYDAETGDCKEPDCGLTPPQNPMMTTTQICCERWPLFKWNAEKGICECGVNASWDDERNMCVECSKQTDEQCETNADCCKKDDFCAFLEPESDTNKGMGKCISWKTYEMEEIVVKGERFRRSKPVKNVNDMNWWTAQNWCRKQDFNPATRAAIGCADIYQNDKICESDIISGWQAKGWTTTAKNWLEQATTTEGWTVRFTGAINNTATGNIHNRKSRSDDRYALCYRDYCDIGLYWDDISESCIECNPSTPAEAVTQKCCEDNDWLWSNNTCICPNGMAWDETNKKCSFCTYGYTEPTSPVFEQRYYAPCAYNYTAPSTISPAAGHTCAAGQYCVLKWTDNVCSDTVGDAGQSTIWGVCKDLEDGPPNNCDSYTINDRRASLTEGVVCSEGRYCYLQWIDENCTSMEDSNVSTLYGVCVDLEKDTPKNCPISTGE